MRRPGVGAGRRIGFRGLGGGGGAAPAYSYLTDWGANMAAVYDLGVGVTQAGTVSAIADQSGRGNTLVQASGTLQPTYTAASAAFNSQPTMTGDGVDDYLPRSGYSIGGPATQLTQVLVARLITNTNGRAWAAVGGASLLGTQTTANRLTLSSLGGAVTGATVWTTAAHVLIATNSGTTLTSYADGVSVGTAAAAGTLADGSNLSLLATTSGTFPSNMEIAFYALIRGALTAGQIADFTTYAQTRWGTP